MAAQRPGHSVEGGFALETEVDQLRTELELLRAERGRLLERQRHIMELVGAADPDRLIHDLRNVLNERELLRVG